MGSRLEKDTDQETLLRLQDKGLIILCEEKGYYGVISVGQLSFDCYSYCWRSRRMQGLSGTNRERKKGRAEFGKKLIIYEGTMGITGRSRPRYKSL